MTNSMDQAVGGTAPAAGDVLEALGCFLRDSGVELPDGGIGPEFDLLLSGVLDSLGTLQLTSFLGERFGVEFADEDYAAEHFATAGSLARLVVEKWLANTA